MGWLTQAKGLSWEIQLALMVFAVSVVLLVILVEMYVSALKSGKKKEDEEKAEFLRILQEYESKRAAAREKMKGKVK